MTREQVLNLIKEVNEKNFIRKKELEQIIIKANDSDIQFTKILNKILEESEREGLIQNVIGEIYERKLNKLEEALEFYKKAFEVNGNFIAALNIARWYEKGIYFRRDLKNAVNLYKLIANSGNSVANYRLGYIYEMGEYCEKNIEKAIHFYERASLLEENRDALYNLGMIYLKQNKFSLGEEKLKQAIKQKNYDAYAVLGGFYERNNNYEKAINYYLEGANCLNGRSLLSLGIMYERGKGVAKNLIKAREYYSKATDLGNEDARKFLMAMGEFNQKDIEIIELNAQNGDFGSKQLLAKFYYDNNNYEKAKNYALETSFFGSTDSIHILGLIELNLKNYKGAISYFEKAREKNYIPSIISEAWTYYCMGDYINSEKIYLEALEISGKDILSVCKMLGRIYYNRKEYDLSEEYYQKIENITLDVEAVKARAYIRFLKKDFQESIKYYLLIENNLKAGDYLKLACCFEQMENYKASLEYIEKGLILDFENVQLIKLKEAVQGKLEKIYKNLLSKDEIVLNEVIETIVENKNNIEPIYNLLTEPEREKKIYKDIEFCALGGGDEIGASCYFIKVDGKKFLIDSGFRIKENSDKEFFPKFSSLFENNLLESERDLDMILLTHGHLDHVGSLMSAAERFKEAPIFCSGATRDLAYFLLNEVNFTEKSEFFDDKYTFKKYEQLALEKLITRMSIKNIGDEINGDGYKIKLYEAGHILGARMILIDIDGYKILFTGDFSEFNQQTIPKYKLPENLKVDLLITEATNFNRKENNSREKNIENLISKINGTLNFETGSILIPAFSIGRAQEVALLIKEAMTLGKISKNVPIYLDGTARIVSKIYEKHGVKIYDEYIKEAEPSLLYNIHNEQAIIISSSGMLLDGCKASRYTEKMLSDIKNNIIFTGYLSPQSKGSKLLSAYNQNLENFIINGKKISLNAEINSISLGAHVSQEGIDELIEKVEPKKVLLTHYNPKYSENNTLFDRLTEKYMHKNIQIILGYNKLVTYL